MKYPQTKTLKKLNTALVVALCVIAAASSVMAQKRIGRLTDSTDIILAPQAIGVNIEQCANGPLSAPVPCNTSSANDGYTRGNLNGSKSHYLEGQFVPIRVIADGLTIGSTYTVTLGYDYTKGGKYAVDYLGDYDYTESVNNNPCVGVTGCTLAGETTAPIPTDPTVTAGFDQIAGTADDITQIAGSFSCFGCTITSVSAYSFTGATTGDSTKSITLTFTAQKDAIVIAYGAHISTRSDWGSANSAINISGSPYHNYVVDFPGANQGNRDLQLSADAVIFPGSITITKLVTTVPVYSSSQIFTFGVSPAVGTAPSSPTSSLSLQDLDPTLNGGDSKTITGITTFGTNIVITEGQVTGWTLADVTCTASVGSTASSNLGNRTGTINLIEGGTAQCTFKNNQLFSTAAPASISGRVTDAFGNGVSGARVSVQNASDGVTYTALTNPFGYYTVSDLAINEFYVMTVSSKRYTFSDGTRTFSLTDNLADVDFVANP